MGRQEDIHSLIEANRYSLDLIPELEKYVQEQVSGRHYDLEANLALLKLYQFYPDKASVSVISHILIKAIMSLPQPDLIMSLYLISEKIQSDEKIAPIIAAADLLERAQFKDFWARVKGNQQFSSVNGFEETMRDFAVAVLSKTYRTAPKSVVGDVLGVADVDSFIKTKGWKVTDSAVHLPEEQTQLKFKPATDNIRFDQFSKVLHSLK
eukprot:TRINITY_DN99_c0_g1_i3.p1 TRINITY_DN99_c0_g1~~TRINITY_DN99_c0_g1_i3.p1  ORF type:complete len:221 (+),score=40.94 TRINITY_DN99_c0_g1_i3:38-664(+)